MSSGIDLGAVPLNWTVVGTGDFNGDGVSDILWRDTAGDLAIWLMNSTGQEASGTTYPQIPTTWSVAATGDFDGNGTSDILWLDTSGNLGVWLMNGLAVSSQISLGNGRYELAGARRERGLRAAEPPPLAVNIRAFGPASG